MPILRNKRNNFFKTWSTEMAYVLGYFAADGSMIRNKRGAHYIEFQSTDRELIECVQRCLETNLKITSKLRWKHHKVIHRIQIGSKELFGDLSKLGLTQNKSLTLKFPQVPTEFLPHFVR